VIGFAHNFSVSKQMKTLCTLKTYMFGFATVSGKEKLLTTALHMPNKFGTCSNKRELQRQTNKPRQYV
jgi:hypothetical protein